MSISGKRLFQIPRAAMRLTLVALLLTSLGVAADWPRFRGPNGSGVADGAQLPPAIGPAANVVWSAAMPTGKSSPALTADRIYLTAHEGGKLLTLALDRADGRLLWRREAPSRRLEKMHRLNDEASASPVTDGENVYVFFGGFGLLSYGPDGAERWRLPLGPFTNFHGMGASPLLVDGKLVMICDQDQGAFVIALDKDTGDVSWRVERPEMVHSFSTPAVYRGDGGEAEVIVAGSYRMVAYAVDTGQESWRWRGLTYQVKSVPVVVGDRIFFNGWAPGGEPAVRLVLPPFEEALQRLDADGDHRLSKEEVPQNWHPSNWDMQDLGKDGVFDAKDWKYYSQRRTSSNSTLAIQLGGRGDITESHLLWLTRKGMPDVPGVLVYRDTLYLIKNGGILTTLDPDTGAVLSQGRVRDAIDNYYASPVAGDGKIYLASEKGIVTVLDVATLEALSTSDFAEAVYATPAIGDGRIYLRTETRLYCFGVDEDEQP